jgi:hypothetical protein
MLVRLKQLLAMKLVVEMKMEIEMKAKTFSVQVIAETGAVVAAAKTFADGFDIFDIHLG